MFGGFRSIREFFTDLDTSALKVKGCTRYLRPLNSEGSLACRTYCDT